MHTQHTEEKGFSLFRMIGGIASDIVEGVDQLGKHFATIPDHLEEGWKEGCLIDTEYSKAKQTTMEAKVVEKRHDANPLTPDTTDRDKM